MSVKEPWDETDEGGTVTFATVQTVSTKNNAHSLALLVEKNGTFVVSNFSTCFFQHFKSTDQMQSTYHI